MKKKIYFIQDLFNTSPTTTIYDNYEISIINFATLVIFGISQNKVLIQSATIYMNDI